MNRSLPTHTFTIVCDGMNAIHTKKRIRTLLEAHGAYIHSLTVSEGRITAEVSVDVRGSVRVPRALDATPYITFYASTEHRTPADSLPVDY